VGIARKRAQQSKRTRRDWGGRVTSTFFVFGLTKQKLLSGCQQRQRYKERRCRGTEVLAEKHQPVGKYAEGQWAHAWTVPSLHTRPCIPGTRLLTAQCASG